MSKILIGIKILYIRKSISKGMERKGLLGKWFILVEEWGIYKRILRMKIRMYFNLRVV